jgi:energy-coupling factor transporter ATP-binding protein EcfA2
MVIVGLTGSIGSGKTTLADYLQAVVPSSGHWESWQLIAEVAAELRKTGTSPDPDDIDAINEWLQPLPDIIGHICHKKVSYSQIKLPANPGEPESYDKLRAYLLLAEENPSLIKKSINTQNKETFRSLLQWLGGYLAKTCGGDIWYAELIRRIQAEDKLELAVIGGVRFVADAECIQHAGGFIVAVERPGTAVRDITDATERERSLIALDSTVYNDATLADLEICAGKLAHDLQAHTLKTEYYARGQDGQA